MSKLFSIDVDGLSDPFLVRADPTESDLIDLRERRLLKNWRKSKFKAGRLPMRSDLDPALMSELAPYLTELSFVSGGDLRFDSYGKALAQVTGRDLTGTFVGALSAPIAKALFSVYRLSAKTAFPYATSHKPPPPPMIAQLLQLILPLRTEARDVGGFLICSVPVQR